MSELNFRLFEKEKPGTKQSCYLICRNENGALFQTIATYIPRMQVPAEEFCNDELWDSGDLDYHARTDTYYTPEGFYEGSLSDTLWSIHEEVLAWAPIFNETEKNEIIKSLQK